MESFDDFEVLKNHQNSPIFETIYSLFDGKQGEEFEAAMGPSLDILRVFSSSMESNYLMYILTATILRSLFPQLHIQSYLDKFFSNCGI